MFAVPTGTSDMGQDADDVSDIGRIPMGISTQEEKRRFRLDHAYDRDRADPRSRSRYGNYLNQHQSTFEELDGDYGDPSVPFAVTVWRIATGPIMSPPFVVSPKRVLNARLERNDWNGEAIINAELITALPTALSDARTSTGSWYRGWSTGYGGQYEGVDDRELESGPYLLPRAQMLFQIPPGTLPHIVSVPTRAGALLDQALECLNVTVRVLNREIGPLLDRMEG